MPPRTATDSLTSRHIAYLGIMHMLGAMVLDGVINFALATAMYKGTSNPVMIWPLPNTLAGEAAVTIIIQTTLTWFLDRLAVAGDLKKGLVAPLRMPRNAHPWIEWFVGLEELQEARSKQRYSGKEAASRKQQLLQQRQGVGKDFSQLGGDFNVWPFPEIFKGIYGFATGITTPFVSYIALIYQGETMIRLQSLESESEDEQSSSARGSYGRRNGFEDDDDDEDDDELVMQDLQRRTMPTAQEKRELLFNIHNPVELPTKEFEDDWWPLISNAWSCNSGPKPTPVGAPLGYIKTYSCRLSKQSTPKSKEATPVNKRRARSVRAAFECQAAIKITHIHATGVTVVERFNDAPAVHTHSLADVDKVKRPAVIKNLIGKEVLKNSNPQDTIASIRQLAEDSGMGEAAAFVTRSELSNSRRKQRQNELEPLVGDIRLEDEVRAATEFLNKYEYKHLSFGGAQDTAMAGALPLFSFNSDTTISSSSSSSNSNDNRIDGLTQGFVFARSQQLDKLATHGWLTLIGSVESINRHDWKLFTLYVRDRLGCWDSGAHFLVNVIDSAAISQALRLIRQLAPSWQPRYILTDRTPAVIAGIETTFPRTRRGTSQQQEQEPQQCEILFSTTHTIQIWSRGITDLQAQRRMTQALHCRTRLGYEYMVERASSGCEPGIKQYIQDNCLVGMEQWALWARQESPLLLQVASLSVLDTYHREVRRLSPAIYGLVGSCQAIMEVDDSKMKLSLKAPTATYSEDRSSTLYDDIPPVLLAHIRQFPYTIQLLLIDEAHAMVARITEGKRVPSMKHLQCGCDFFNKNLLPCRHVLHAALFGDATARSPKETVFLSDTDWMRLQNLFTDKEIGLDVYRTRRAFESGEEAGVGTYKSAEDVGLAEVKKLKMEELLERLQQSYRDLAERGDERGTEVLVEEFEGLCSRHENAAQSD
ncbi:hypothetical protein BGZ95_001956 [Linnemannia exigua]|uniref:SWIM-type domain-containing protein n=1 Tax=Linnemannia exigua TaxID=604196 RepID=A0AAD4H3Q0_9FUNG|nr:hypothetical protein BGZ95_001956 [Linnemannia exigua]